MVVSVTPHQQLITIVSGFIKCVMIGSASSAFKFENMWAKYFNMKQVREKNMHVV